MEHTRVFQFKMQVQCGGSHSISYGDPHVAKSFVRVPIERFQGVVAYRMSLY